MEESSGKAAAGDVGSLYSRQGPRPGGGEDREVFNEEIREKYKG